MTDYYQLAKQVNRKLKNTAQFYAVDLHCHTPLSYYFGRIDKVSYKDINATGHQIAKSGCQSNLHILGITDHNRCDNVEEVKSAAEDIKRSGENQYSNNNLVVLPGIEITVEESFKNIHILALFSEDKSIIEIERIFDKTGIEPDPEKRTKESKVNTKRIIEVVQKIRELNGIAILAHVNSDNGYRKEMKNCGLEDHEVKQKIDELSIDGIEINKPEDAKHFEFEGKKYPCVIGSDAHYIHEIGGKEHITRIKMTTSSFNDLQKALLDPETRIRYQDQQSSYIKKVLGIKFEGGFLDEQTIPFSSNLNCLIGPRGSGKSTCIEAIRYIFDKHVPEDRTKDINRLRSNVFPDCCVFHGRWPPSPCDGGQ